MFQLHQDDVNPDDKSLTAHNDAGLGREAKDSAEVEPLACLIAEGAD
jgi:hypothetical protein